MVGSSKSVVCSACCLLGVMNVLRWLKGPRVSCRSTFTQVDINHVTGGRALGGKTSLFKHFGGANALFMPPAATYLVDVEMRAG